MKVAFVTDTHFGYRRFEKDALEQGREAILSAAREADLIILGGDNFDTPLPRMETLAEVTKILVEVKEIYRSKGIMKTPIFAIHGNHDRRAKGFVHPTELLSHSGLVDIVHNKTIVFEKNGEKIAISGMGNVPDDLAKEGISKLACKPVQGAFNIFVLHQSFKEHDIAKNEQLMSFDDLPDGFDLYLCGHVHKPNLSGRVLNPGSTVVTQLREDEIGKRGWLLYDTLEKQGKFVPVASRQLFYSELVFEKATPDEIKAKAVLEAGRLKKQAAIGKPPLVRIVLKGTLADGFHSADLRMPELGDEIFIDNSLNSNNLRERIAQIKLSREKKQGSKELGMQLLRKRLEGTPYALGDPEKVFEMLLDGSFLPKTVEKIEEKKAV